MRGVTSERRDLSVWLVKRREEGRWRDVWWIFWGCIMQEVAEHCWEEKWLQPLKWKDEATDSSEGRETIRSGTKLPSSLVMVRVAEHTTSPVLLLALQLYCPACSGKASTRISVAVFVTSSKWKTTSFVGWMGSWLWNQLICGFGVPDTQAWNLATSPWDTVLLAIGWIKVGFCPIECFFGLVRQVETCSSGSQRARPERKHVDFIQRLGCSWMMGRADQIQIQQDY